MLRVQFNDKKSRQNVEFQMLSDSSVQLTGSKLKENTSGFKVYRLNGDFLGDYSEFTKCKKVTDGLVFEKNKKIFAERTRKI